MMDDTKLIMMSSIPDSAIENTNRPLAYLDQSFKVDEEYKQKLKENEVRWPNKQYLIVPRAHGKKAVIDELKKLWRKKGYER